MSSATDGLWESPENWPLIGIHAILTSDGKVLSFGTDANGMQSGEFIYDVWDPVTNQHYTLANTTPTDIFCSAAIIIPETGNILIGGGDDRPNGDVNSGVDDVNIYYTDDMSLEGDALGDMAYERWYPTMVSLNTGQIVILGGSDGDHRGVGHVEMYTPGEGWRTMTGAYNSELAENATYPRAWVNGNDEIIYLPSNTGGDGNNEVYAMDAAGNGSVRQIGTLPFDTTWSLPATTYAPGKALIMGFGGQVWSMDFSGATPTFQQMASLPEARYWSDMTVMADGRVLLSGGTNQNSIQSGSSTWEHTAAIWDPDTNTWTQTVDEVFARLYHSTTLLLPDATILSLGGGAPGPQTNLNGEIYKPDYLFNADGSPAVRPQIVSVAESVAPNGTLTLTMDEAASITKVTFVKTGASTHSFNMDQAFVELEFTLSGNDLIAQLPENANILTAGNWMVFAWNSDGVPSTAEIVRVETTGAYYDNVGELHAEYFDLSGAVSTLGDIDFDATPDHEADVLSLNTQGTTGSMWDGGPSDDFAARFTGQFKVNEGGQFTFYLTSDDGSALYVNGQGIIDNDGLHPDVLRTASINLDAGWHDIEVRYFERGGNSTLDLDWAGPGFTRKLMIFDGPGFAGPDEAVTSPPTDIDLTNASIAEDAAAGDVVGSLSATDPDTANGFSYAISGGDTANFEIVGNELRVKAGASFDYETAASTSVDITVDDGDGNTYQETFSITVTDVNDTAPVFTSDNAVAVSENVDDQTAFYVAAANDPDTTGETVTFSLSDDASGLFEIDVATGEVSLVDGQTLDYETATSHKITVRASDGTNVIDQAVTINVTDVDENPPADDLLANGGLENPDNPRIVVDDLEGWQNQTGGVEQWLDGVFGVAAYEGTGFVELDNESGLDNLYQDVNTTAGQNYAITFAARQRDGGESVDVFWNGVKVATAKPDEGDGWTTFRYVVTGNGGADRLEFRELASENDTGGPFLDGIGLEATDDPVTDPNPQPTDLLVNGGLENTANPRIIYGELDGWQSQTGDVELWRDGVFDVAAFEGGGFVELDKEFGLDNLYQDIQTTAGQNYEISFAGRQRDDAGESIELYWNGEKVATVTPADGTAWSTYAYVVEGTGGLDRLEFRELASENNTGGPFLDGIDFAATVEPTTEPEPVGDILVNGGLENPDNGRITYGPLEGWQNQTGQVEHWLDGTDVGAGPVSAFEGEGFVELDNEAGLDNLFQDVTTEAGQDYTLSFAALQRTGGESVEVFWAGTLLDTVTPNEGTDWTVFEFTVTGSGGLDRLEFRELAAENDTAGPFLDGVSLIAVEEEAAATFA